MVQSFLHRHPVLSILASVAVGGIISGVIVLLAILTNNQGKETPFSKEKVSFINTGLIVGKPVVYEISPNSFIKVKVAWNGLNGHEPPGMLDVLVSTPKSADLSIMQYLSPGKKIYFYVVNVTQQMRQPPYGSSTLIGIDIPEMDVLAAVKADSVQVVESAAAKQKPPKFP